MVLALWNIKKVMEVYSRRHVNADGVCHNGRVALRMNALVTMGQHKFAMS
jgi:hypothetical protein